MISISITVASLGRALQRQCDNRHHLVTQVVLFRNYWVYRKLTHDQAIAFLARYRSLRAVHGDHTVEIEYNVGRTFHHLGTTAPFIHSNAQSILNS